MVDSECANVTKPGFKGKSKADANCDGFTNGLDYSAWRKENIDKVKTNGRWEADFNCDNVVNGYDYSAWRKYYIDLAGI